MINGFHLCSIFSQYGLNQFPWKQYVRDHLQVSSSHSQIELYGIYQVYFLYTCTALISHIYICHDAILKSRACLYSGITVAATFSSLFNTPLQQQLSSEYLFGDKLFMTY